MRKVSYKGDMKNAVQVVGRNIPISRKISRELAVFIKGKYIDRAVIELERVTEGKLAIPYKRYNRDTPHRKGKMMSGRFPKSASLQIVKLLKSLKTNAENKGLDEESILIVHAACQHAGIAWHYGRHRRRRRKLAHFELVGVEKEREEAKKKVEKKKKVETPPPQTPSPAPAVKAEKPEKKKKKPAKKEPEKKVEKKPAKKKSEKKTEKKPAKKKEK